MLAPKRSHTLATSFRVNQTPFTQRKAPLKVAASSSAPSPAAPSTAERTLHTLPDGMRLEFVRYPAASQASTSRSSPPLLFVHGSYHAAWCWEEHFQPFFAAAGFDTVAISLRGQGGSDRTGPQGELKVSGDLQSHADDLASVIASLPEPPVLVAHSFGGLLVEKYCSQLDRPGRPPIAGVALLCSVPPSGNKDIVVRITKKSLITSFKITWAFVAKSFAKSLDACRETFFSADIPEADLRRYQAQLAACSPVRLLDLGALNKELPLPPLPAAAAGLPAFVAGGVDDLVVDPLAVAEAAAYFGVQPVMWDGMAHDCMLDTRWERAAVDLWDWLRAEFSKES